MIRQRRRRRRNALVPIVVLVMGLAAGAGVTVLLQGGSSQRTGAATRMAGTTDLPHNRRRARRRDTTEGQLRPDAGSSFRRLEDSLPGPVELSVLPVSASRAVTFGGDRIAHGWSTTKVPVLVALMRARTNEGLSSRERSLARAAITESSNQAALDLFSALESAEGGLGGASEYVEGILRAAGDTDTVVATAPPPPGAVTRFGQTDWRPAEAVRFFSALDRGCLLSVDGTRYVLGLMQEIVPSESWGLGAAGFAHVAFKGGWGPEGDSYLVRQSGIIEPASGDADAVAIVAYPPAGPESFAVGTQMVTAVARWLHDARVPPSDPTTSEPACSPSNAAARIAASSGQREARPRT